MRCGAVVFIFSIYLKPVVYLWNITCIKTLWKCSKCFIIIIITTLFRVDNIFGISQFSIWSTKEQMVNWFLCELFQKHSNFYWHFYVFCVQKHTGLYTHKFKLCNHFQCSRLPLVLLSPWDSVDYKKLSPSHFLWVPIILP